MKQIAMFGREENSKPQKYSNKIEAPIYEPKNQKPYLGEMLDNTKTRRLITEINESGLPDEEKGFLIAAAHRHTVFNYEKIADYYSHSPKEVQELMEKSALVIIDFDKAIEGGYIKLCNSIKDQYLTEYGE